MATGGNEIASDEIPDFQCISCDKRTVVKYCVDCQGYCCQSCVDAHSRFPTMKGHTLLEDQSCAESKLAKLPLVLTVKCDIHTIKVLDMYCGDHDVVCCTTCMALDHRSCNNVHSILHDIDFIFDTSEIKEVSEKLQKGKETLENIEIEKDELLEGLLASKEEADNTIKNAIIKIIDDVKRMEKKSLEEVHNVYQERKLSEEKERKQASNMVIGIGKISDRIIATEGNKVQQFVNLKIGKRKIKHVNEFQSSLAKENVAKINFSVDPNIQNCFRNTTTFGKTNIKSSVKDKTDLYRVEKCVDMNVRLSRDSSSCCISGSCLTEDGSLLMVDTSNKKLKHANIHTVTIDAFCNFDASPWSVCCTSRQEAVVTYTNADYIQFVSLGNQLTPSRKVKVSRSCVDINCKDDKLYITDYRQSVYIHDMNGKQLHVVSPVDSSGNRLFKATTSITFSDATKDLIVGDWYKGVIILDGEFQRVASFSDNDLYGIRAVCTDNRGNIFVCGHNSHNVMQIGYDGKKRGVIVSTSNGLNFPCSVCFDSSQCRLIVTHVNDIVKIFDLK